MNGFATFCLLCVLLCCSVSWLLPKVLAWLLKRKFFIEVQIGRIGIPYLTLKDVYISKSGFSMHIDEIGFRSSFFSSEVTKLLAVVVRDVRINKDVGVAVGKKDQKSDKAEYQQQFSGLEDGRTINFHNRKVPPMIITFAQFMAIHVYNVNTMFLCAESPEWLVCASAGEVRLDGSIVHNARTLLVNVTVVAATAKMLRHAQKRDDTVQTCLGELSFGISMEAILIAQGPLSVEKLIVGMEHTKAIINEGFYNFSQERRRKREAVRSPMRSLHSADTDIFQRLSPIIPKNFNLRIDDSVLTGMRDSHTDFNATLRCFQVDTQFSPPNFGLVETEVGDMLPQVFLAVQIDELNVKCNKETVLLLRKFAVESKLENNILNNYMLLNTLTLTYNHNDIYSWILSSFSNSCDTQEMEHLLDEAVSVKQETVGSTSSWLEILSHQCQIKGFVELWSVSALISLSGDAHCVSIGFSHTNAKFLLDQHSELQEYGAKWGSLSFLLGGCHWSAELLVESLWCHLGNSSLGSDTHLLKKYHTWGTPVFLGVFLVKLRTQGSNQSKLNAMLDTLRFEWSPPFRQFITQGFRCICEYKNAVTGSHWSSQEGIPAVIEAETSKKVDVVKYLESCIISVSLTNANAFFIADKRVCIMARIDSTSIESVTSKLMMALEGAKLASICPTKSHYTCLRSEELKAVVGHVKLARLNYKRKNCDLSVQLLDEVQAQWSANLHLKLLTLIQEISKFTSDMEALAASSEEFSKQKPRNHNANHKNLHVQVKGQVIFGITISSRHRMDLASDDIIGAMNGESAGIKAMSVKIAIDNKDIFSVNGFQMAKLSDCEEVETERKNNESFVLPWNKTWNITISSLKACFPYEHSFAEAVQNELVSVVKWLKLVHKQQRQPFTSDSPLPADLVIKVKEFLFEMSDDPFEVRLRDNYELLEDEYKESLKRQKMLDVKVAELCKAHLLLPAGKVEELYASLSKRNTEIYVQDRKSVV